MEELLKRIEKSVGDRVPFELLALIPIEC